MFGRFLTLVLLQGMGAALGWWGATAWEAANVEGRHETLMAWGACGALLGLAVGTWIVFALDSRRASRVLAWLRRDGAPASAAPSANGMWGEVSDRMRRRVREGERQARDSQARLDEILAALQASPNGVVLLDTQGGIEWCNQMASDHFGIDLARDLQQSIGNLVRDPAFAAYWAARDFSGSVAMPGRRSTSSRPVRLSVHLHPYGAGRTLLLSNDVTAVEQAEAMRRDFVANVSHEVRTPLTVLTGFVETLQNIPLEAEERAHYLRLMAQQAGRMQSVVSDLLTLSRLEGSPPPGHAGYVPLQALIAQSEQEGSALSELLGRRHTLHFPDAQALAAAGEISGSQNELQSAMSNLVGNAVRYTPAGGTITVGWTLLDGNEPARGAVGEGEFSVQDTGPGIAPEHIPRLTERFYRVDRSRSRETGGTGLGLAIVKHVMQRHGGRLRITSTPGAGSTFTLVFPAGRLRGAATGAAGAAGISALAA
ncbi:MAG: phosphate regulon sensor histidine kinase PhoR [Pseudomonadota bacterium]